MDRIALLKELKESASWKAWQQVGVTDHHGLCVPLFSLHSWQSAGIGEYLDLIPMISWCKDVGLDTLQLLPLNDTGMNSSPYSAISAFALNPLHLSLAALPHVQSSDTLKLKLKKLQFLTSTTRVDYHAILPLREEFLKEYFSHYSDLIMAEEAFQQFIASSPWLCGYALFKALKSKTHWQSFTLWPEEFKDLSSEAFEALQKKYESDIAYHSLVQYFCFAQMKEVKKHADTLNVFLKGDIPILVDRESADVWQHPHLFNLELSAGAPPDAYSEEGQNWQFPLYNWQEMEKDGYQWWKDRLAVASEFYHIYRIDHVVGFFRIWAIEACKTSKEGSFIPSDPEVALAQGDSLLRMMINATNMLPIGEDLGTIPPAVRSKLRELGICGTKVMRWERYWEGDHSYIPPQNYEPISITTVSTHDSSTLQQWWQENSDEAIAYCASQNWEYTTPLTSDYHFALLYTSHHTASLFHINLLQEYLALIPQMVSVNPHDERINCPGVISDFNWSYRFKPSVEELIVDEEVAQIFRDIIS